MVRPLAPLSAVQLSLLLVQSRIMSATLVVTMVECPPRMVLMAKHLVPS
jgi:hypothetical protein